MASKKVEHLLKLRGGNTAQPVPSGTVYSRKQKHPKRDDQR